MFVDKFYRQTLFQYESYDYSVKSVNQQTKTIRGQTISLRFELDRLWDESHKNYSDADFFGNVCYNIMAVLH